MTDKWRVTNNVTSYQVWRQIRPLEPGEPMHAGVREYADGFFETREEAEAYADRLNEEDGDGEIDGGA